MDSLDIISWFTSWTTLTTVILLPLLYWYLLKPYNYWSKRGIRGPKPVPIVGNDLQTFISPMPLVELEWFKKYGKIYGVYRRDKPVLTIAKPELIKTILVKDFHLFPDRKTRRINHEVLSKNLFFSEGEDWKRYRSITSPTFTSGKMKKMYPMIRECLKEYLKTLDDLAINKSDINLKDMNGNFTMDVIATCAFATKTNAHKEPNNAFVINARKIFDFSFVRVLGLLVLPKQILELIDLKSASDESSNQFFIQLTKHVVKQRKDEPNSHQKYNDFIQLLVDAHNNTGQQLPDENDVNEAHHVNDGEEEREVERKVLSGSVVNKHLTELEIMAQGWIFFVAGYETTATTLTFCSYELALNPKVQDRLYEEIETAVDANGEISYDKLSKLPFLDSVLSETLRLYPPVLRLDRRVVTDYKLGDTGIQLFAGQEVEIPVYAIHHSDEFYPNAHQFDPDRFMPENRHKIIPYTYLPFGAGPRNCIGMRFALMEAKLGLAHIIRRFRFFKSPQTAVPLEFKPVTRLCAAKQVVVGIEMRNIS
ncbi:cytochrome P450 3A14-like [Oppia nitens]|uniref:cytochrome P450 3A14-like n=1 Tax=Oppia nitens TaxID=1686743 RepID=UPI0023DCE957|nr:cytochrome P450 3A14-like [Oppia nitens]